jgi:hypothetical protein
MAIRFVHSGLLVVLVFMSGCAFRAQRYSDLRTPTPFAPRDTIVIGFVGGRESWRDQRIGVTRLAKRLRSRGLDGLQVETVENMKRGMAFLFVKRGLDRDGDGWLDLQERQSARIILYGQSFGGAAVVKFARQLAEIDVPVLMTVQVDSVGRDDELVPANVRVAANFYQDNGPFIRGARNIRASNPQHTKILFNRRFDYRNRQIELEDVAWYKKVLRSAHVKMDNDPEVWNEVERLILQEVSVQAERRPALR